ncbi:MAG: T9SS type A sorting domain-containing protein [Bacteroidales bacterium]|nr:T9SS type A sorting domain-containing protein [Bacteroidales bacterium]
MKYLISILLIFLGIPLLAQNWRPIRANSKMNFRHSGADIITNTIWVDSVKIVYGDSAFYFNRIVKDVPGNPDIVLRNQPQFLEKEMVRLGNSGWYRFSQPGKFYLNTHAKTGDTWIFDSTGNIVATVIETTIMDIFGIADSVKTIDLNSGIEDIIRISKNFGLIGFPDLEDDGVYTLEGIQGTEYGTSVTDFRNIFDFQTGDVFQYTGDAGGGSTGQIDYYTLKYAITSKDSSITELKYGYQGYKKGFVMDLFNPSFSYNYAFPVSGLLVYTASSMPLSDLMPNELVFLEDCYCIDCYNGTVFARPLFSKDSLDINTKTIGFRWQSDDFTIDGELLSEMEACIDTMARYDEYYNFEGILGITLKSNLGIVEYNAYYFEDDDVYKLEGYIKDGDTVGTITPDSLLYVKIPDHCAENHIGLLVSPNPAGDFISVQSEYENLRGCLLTLKDISGRTVMQASLSGKDDRIDVSTVSKGIYLFLITRQNTLLRSGKVIIE